MEKSIAVYFNITKSDVENVRKIFGKDENSVKEDLKILNDWWKKQLHLPKNKDDTRLEKMLLRNKYRVEQTKLKIDNYYTIHGVYPEIFQTMRGNFKGIMAQFKHVRVFLSPIYNNTYERIIYFRLCDENCKPDWKQLINAMIVLQETLLTLDFSIGERYIIDFKNVRIHHYTGVTAELNFLLKFAAMYQEAFSGRLIGAEYINAPNFIGLFLQFFKMVLKPKLFNKIRIHKTLADLHKVIDPKYLPEDLGGALRPVEEYHNEMQELVPLHSDAMFKQFEQKSDETLRIGKSCVTQMFGIEGTFKKINID